MLKFVTFSVLFLIFCEICFCSPSEYSTEIISIPQTTSTTTTTANPLQRSRKRSEYGEPCNKTLRCKSQSWLSCDYEESRCQCAKPDEMVYDEDRKKCVALIGERCKYEAFVEEGIGGVFEVTECTEGAVCGVDGVCVCPPSTYEDGEGYRCINKKDVNSNCSFHVECDNFKFLGCINKTCQCFVPEDMGYEAGVCKLKAGRPCNPYDPFALSTLKDDVDTVNLQRHINSNLSVPKCFAGLNCDLNVCSCSPNQYLNYKLGVCQRLKEKGESCIVAAECNSEKMLTCLDSRCQCDPNIAIENPSDYSLNNNYGNFYIPRGVCVGKIDTSCNSTREGYYNQYHYNRYRAVDVYFKHCIQDSECVNGVCICKNGLVPTKAKLCGVAYNQGCSINKPCADKFTCTSISIQNFMYTSFLCTCPNPEYQDKSGICQSYIGFPCDPTDPSACVKGAECIRQGGRNICNCKKGFVKSINGQQCEIAYGGKCSNNIEAICDQKAELQCRIVVNNFGEMDQLCTCPNLEDFYEPTRRMCSKTIGISCRQDEECVTNAFCSFDDKELSQDGVCQCIEGFASSSESHTCAPAPYFLPSMKNVTNDSSLRQTTSTDELFSSDENMEDISATTPTSDELIEVYRNIFE